MRNLVYEHKNESLNKDEEGDDYFADGKDEKRLHDCRRNESSIYMCV